MKEEISAVEALFGFCGWLTTRPKIIKMGKTENCAPVADLIDKYSKANKLKPPRENFSDYLKTVKEAEKCL